MCRGCNLRGDWLHTLLNAQCSPWWRTHYPVTNSPRWYTGSLAAVARSTLGKPSGYLRPDWRSTRKLAGKAPLLSQLLQNTYTGTNTPSNVRRPSLWTKPEGTESIYWKRLFTSTQSPLPFPRNGSTIMREQSLRLRDETLRLKDFQQRQRHLSVTGHGGKLLLKSVRILYQSVKPWGMLEHLHTQNVSKLLAIGGDRETPLAVSYAPTKNQPLHVSPQTVVTSCR